MRVTKIVLRLIRLGRPRQILLTEAMAAVAVASAAIRLLPFQRAVRLGSRRLESTPRNVPLADLRWAVRTVARYVPWRAVCFQQGLALQWMLRRRGVDAALQYGIMHDAEGELQAHVWVTANDSIVIGGEEAPTFRRVATFPSASG